MFEQKSIIKKCNKFLIKHNIILKDELFIKKEKSGICCYDINGNLYAGFPVSSVKNAIDIIIKDAVLKHFQQEEERFHVLLATYYDDYRPLDYVYNKTLNVIKSYDKTYYNTIFNLLSKEIDLDLSKEFDPLMIIKKILEIDKRVSSHFILKEEDNLEIGSSKIGGYPDLPEGFKWPYYEFKENNKLFKLPLSFLCQINLEEIKSDKFPNHGYLYFFYEFKTMKWGFDPSDDGCAKVFYYDVDSSNLRRIESPNDLSSKYVFRSYKIKFKDVEEIPSFDEFYDLYHIDVDYDEYCLTAKKISKRVDSDCQTSKLLGYADIIQTSMLEDCELVNRGYYIGDRVELSDDEREDVYDNLGSWILLCQITTIDDDLLFGDDGAIYFYIKEEDLVNKRFDKIKLFLQCY